MFLSGSREFESEMESVSCRGDHHSTDTYIYTVCELGELSSASVAGLEGRFRQIVSRHIQWTSASQGQRHAAHAIIGMISFNFAYAMLSTTSRPLNASPVVPPSHAIFN
jgi:hypothetical protein